MSSSTVYLRILLFGALVFGLFLEQSESSPGDYIRMIRVPKDLMRKRGEGGAAAPAGTHHQCKTVESTIQVSKEDKTTTGDILRICEGLITVHKCEGACLSNLRPSVSTTTGFLKDCICCREGSMHRKDVTLDMCFDLDGNRLQGQSMTVAIPEPRDCSCSRCS